MKTTIEIPDPLFRKAKAAAATQGQTLKQLMNAALRDKLAKRKPEAKPGWMRFFGSMKGKSAEMRRIDAAIEEEFERIDPEKWK